MVKRVIKHDPRVDKIIQDHGIMFARGAISDLLAIFDRLNDRHADQFVAMLVIYERMQIDAARRILRALEEEPRDQESR